MMDSNGVLSSQCIEKLEIIGSGSFGRVFKCRDLRSGEFVAVKEIDLDVGGGDDDFFEELRSEISTLMTCEHPNIIRYRGSYVPNTTNPQATSPLSNRLCIVMDYCERGSLRQVLDQHGPFKENLIAEIAESILRALEYLHRQGISHRDLKGANVLVDAEGKVKLGDFGVAFQPSDSNDEQNNKLVGSPYWMAPEVLSNTVGIDASKADIWSFGITLIELLRGRPPLYYLNPRAAMAAIPRTSPPRLESDDPRASKNLRELIHSCLHDDPRKRPSATQLLKLFKSYFKQQKASLIPGSLARLNSSSATLPQPSSAHPSRKTVSETIYSQWDFDLNTLSSEFSQESVMNHQSESDMNNNNTKIKSSSAATATAKAKDIPESKLKNLVKVEDESVKRAESSNDSQSQEPKTPACSVKFRRLNGIQTIFTPISVNSVLWDDKDTSILPIPCPSDAPDLTKPQKINDEIK